MNRLANKLTRTAPRRIWLQCSDEPDGVRNSFGDHDTGEVTWCADSVLAAEVEYVRADLVRAAMPINANDPDDPELCALAELLGMTANAGIEPGRNV